MTRSFTQFDIHPEQVLLLKAALFPANEALSCWQLWKKARRLDQSIATHENLLPSIFDPLDGDSQRLMPLVYRNLEKSGDPLIPHLRGIYRYTWMTNQRFLEKMKQVINTLHQAKIDTIVLKGIPLSLLYYKDMGVRLMYDLDVLVPTTEADQALQALLAAPLDLQSSKFEYTYRHLHHAMHLWDTRKVDVDLHWNVLSQHAYMGADTLFWASKQPLALTNSLFTNTLSPTHQLFHNFVHGFGWNTSLPPPIRWIADSYVIYTKPDSTINWHALLDMAEWFQLTYPIRQSLRLLQAEFQLALPADVHERLEKMPLSSVEKSYFTLVRKKSSNLVSKVIRGLKRNQLAYQLFRKGKPVPPISHWMYDQIRFRLDWPKRDLPY
ncbi:nucleotidyltransferase family protein [Spirosoma sp. KCTC 42546]|uniref:nucleotidyltransferase family protein n=1 Tax=Spirosoma sp. KCTC 42546 TaxID=2520506 RepID=UPI00115C03FE|nr:nucleotidyltransferase family protein [Spirosoma sp. KCTC 42546]QDK77989.1 nucleotidyltransferase family protein [Spirosoma sp. KCTC 42546]